MFSTFPKLLATYSSLRFLHKYTFKMDKVYLRHIPESNQFAFSFEYVNPELKVNRRFNFCRKSDETVETLLTRIKTNVEKVVNKKNKKKTTENLTSAVNALLFVNNEEVRKDVLCKEVFVPDKDVVIELLDKKYNVIVNSPWVDHLELPKIILANFPLYLNKFETVFVEKNQSDYTWFKSEDQTKWTEVGKGYTYVPTNADIKNYIKLVCIPKNGVATGPAVETVSNCVVEAGPGACPFEIRHECTKNKLSKKEFRIVSYNILADLYCDSDTARQELFPYCPEYALNIDYRKQLFLKEIIGYNADVICLQEVDRKVFNNDLEPIMSNLGYGSNFTVKGGEVVEGLALFYDSNRFKKLQSDRLVFSEHINIDPLYADIWAAVAKNEQLTERILARTTTMQVNALESIENDDVLVVANTHLYFHPDADHIRLLHGAFAIRYLENYVKELKNKSQKRVSLIYCGDFNSTPECGVFKLYTTGSVPSSFIDFNSNKQEAVTDLDLQQSIALASACGTPKYTNYTAGFKDCLDYIFYEKNNIEVIKFSEIPNEEVLSVHIALPSVVFPSDHISLCADLKWN